MTIGVQFGTHSIEALLWVAQTVEEGIYEPDSLHRTADGIAFALDNPCLRVGAFTELRVLVDGTVVPGDGVRLRRGAGGTWRTASSVTPETTWDLAPGDRSEFEILGTFGQGNNSITVRLEMTTRSIPPLVWFEFNERPPEGSRTP